MMKKVLFFLISMLASMYASAQSNIRLSNCWVDTYFINPSTIDELAPSWKFGLAARGQWIKFPGAPVTGMLTAAYYNEKIKSQFGLRFIGDKIGYTYVADANLTYAYSVDLMRKSTSNAYLNFGAAFHFQNLIYDRSQMVFENTMEDPRIHTLQPNYFRFNIDLGLEFAFERFSADRFVVGFSTQNLLSLFNIRSRRDIQDPFANTNILYARYRTNRNFSFPLTSGSKWDFSVNAAGIHSKNVYEQQGKSADIFQFECNANFHINYDQDYIFTLGVIYRTISELGVVFGFDWQKNLTLSLAYEYNLSRMSTYAASSIGTFELIFIYRINPYESVAARCIKQRRR